MITEIILFLIFVGFFFIGFFLIYKQVSLVKKGEFNTRDRLQCIIYGFIFSLAVMVVISMAFIFAVKTPDFWQGSSIPPPDISPIVILLPFIVCLTYISIYPLIDFLFISLSGDRDEGLTPFHKFLSKNIINISKSKFISIFMALLLYLFFILPPFLLSAIGLPFMMIWITWMLVYPLMILTFYGSKGYIAGITNVYYHIPDISRSAFLNFENSKRGMKQFISNPIPYILLGMMLFVFVWAWISMFQTIGFYFTKTLAISTMSSAFVFVTLFFGVIGYFTRFWGRKIKYRGIDIYFAAYLMAAIGINVLVNFLTVNSDKLFDSFNFWVITRGIIPNYLLFTWPAAIEEIVLIIFTSFYFLSQKNDFTKNLKYSKITECGQTFDPIPLFNLIKNPNPEISNYAKNTLSLMYERIPLKSEISLDDWKFKDLLIDGLSDSNPDLSETSFKILIQLEKAVPDLIIPWIIESLESPNYDKSLPFARSLIKADLYLVEKIPRRIFFNLINDSEWRLKLTGLRIILRLIKKEKDLLNYLDLDKLLEDSNSEVQIEILNIFAKQSIPISSKTLFSKLNHSNSRIRAVALKNINNIKSEDIDDKFIKKIIPFMKDPTSSVRASIFETLAKIGRFKKFSIPIAPLLDGLSDFDEKVRYSSVLALEKYFDENPSSLDINTIVNKIDSSNTDILISIISLLGKLWNKDPEKILSILLIFIKFDNEELKEKISRILVDNYIKNPKLIFDNLIKIKDDSKFISKGIVSRTIINIAKKYSKQIIPILIHSLESNDEDIILNSINALDGLIEDYGEKISIKSLLSIFNLENNKKIRKETSQLLSKIAKNNPKLLKPIMNDLFQIINRQESSVKIILIKSLLDVSKNSPELIPVQLIITYLSDRDSFIRETSTKILGYIGYKLPLAVVDTLINKALVDDEWIVRDAAISSIGKIIDHVENRDLIIKKLVDLIDDEKSWVQRSAMNLLSSIKGIEESHIPFEKVSKNLISDDPKVREGSANLLKIYSYQSINEIFEDILLLLGDESEDVRKTMINVMVEIIKRIGLSNIISKLLKNLSDEGSITTQQSIAIILGRTVRYEDEKIKKRVISLLKMRCEMSQDPIICETLAKLKES